MIGLLLTKSCCCTGFVLEEGPRPQEDSSPGASSNSICTQCSEFDLIGCDSERLAFSAEFKLMPVLKNSSPEYDEHACWKSGFDVVGRFIMVAWFEAAAGTECN
jgi:hypothetical protein